MKPRNLQIQYSDRIYYETDLPNRYLEDLIIQRKEEILKLKVESRNSKIDKLLSIPN